MNPRYGSRVTDPDRRSGNRHSEATAYLVLTASAIAWGANTIFGRLAVGEISPMLLVSLRWLLLALCLYVCTRRYVRENWATLRPRLRLVGGMGALGFTGFSALYYTAAHHTTAINIGIVQGAIPAVVLIAARLVDGTSIARRTATGLVLSGCGIVLLVSNGDPARLLELRLNPGDLLMVLASICYASYAVGIRRAPDLSPWSLLLALAVAGWLASLPLVVLEHLAGRSAPPTARGWAIVAAVVLVPSLIGQAGFIRGVRDLGPARAGLFLNLVPVFAAILGVVLLEEPFAPHQGGALVLVLAGIAWAEGGAYRATGRARAA